MNKVALRLPSIFSLAVCCLGFSAFMTQLTLMRELLSVFSGNELVFGIVLGSWMLLTGMGAAWGRTAAGCGRRLPCSLLPKCSSPCCRSPMSSALRSLHNVIFLRGVEVGVTETVASCLALLAPYCLVTGYLLTVACGLGIAVQPFPRERRAITYARPRTTVRVTYPA